MTEFFYHDRHVGTLNEGIFRKRVRKSKHLLRSLNAWGIQFDTLTDLRDGGCTEIRIKDEEEHKVYAVPFNHFYRTATVENFGDGPQAFLPRNEWTVTAAT